MSRKSLTAPCGRAKKITESEMNSTIHFDLTHELIIWASYVTNAQPAEFWSNYATSSLQFSFKKHHSTQYYSQRYY